MKPSRRRFLRLMAAGSAAAVAGPVATAAGATRPVRKTATPAPATTTGKASPPPVAVADEIHRQKTALEKSLKTLRDYPLPAGSEPAFTFVPLKARRKERAS